MKNFYTAHIETENFDITYLRNLLQRGFAVIEFVDIKEDGGRRCREVYDYLFLDGTKEEFEKWAKHEFGYLRTKLIFY